MSKRSAEEALESVLVVPATPLAKAVGSGWGDQEAPTNAVAAKLTKYDEALYSGIKQAYEREREQCTQRIQRYLQPLPLPNAEETEAIILDIHKTIFATTSRDQKDCAFVFFEDRFGRGIVMADYYYDYDTPPWITALKRWVDAYSDADIDPCDRSDVSRYADDQVYRYFVHIQTEWAERHNALHIEVTPEGFVVKY